MPNARRLPELPTEPRLQPHITRRTAMNNTTTVSQHSPAWVAFTYISFAASAFMVGIGIWFLPLELSIKGYLTMGFLMLVQSCITMTKTMRDNHESGKLVNRIEDAKAERLLMEVDRNTRVAA